MEFVPQVITWVISIGSLCIAVYALRLSRANDKRQERLEERQAAIFLREKADKNADFSLEWWDYPSRNHAYIVARNTGGGRATNLRGYFRGDPTHILGFKGETRGPIEPGQTYAIGGESTPFPHGHPPMRLGGPGENDYILSWTDSYGDEQSRAFTMTEITGKGVVDESNLPSMWETNAKNFPIEDSQQPRLQ